LKNLNQTLSGDGRLPVVLCLLLGLLLFDLFTNRFGFIYKGTKKNNRCEQLHFTGENSLVVAGCSEAGRGAVPARYTPFLFALIPINSADRDMLMTVKGIGPVLADKIVLYRQQVGPFKDSLELQKLHGVGAGRAAGLATVFTFSEEP
jgi:DNA uptake protein ComE-like DNA-binding protein